MDKYRDWEANKGEGVPRKNLGAVKSHESCYLLRKRARYTQRQLAVLLGCTRLWLIQMEDGRAPVERLKTYWGI